MLEYLIIIVCNIRCKGCWFFEYDFDKRIKDLFKKDEIKKFFIFERNRGINISLIIGGEFMFYFKRFELFVEIMEFNSILINGFKVLFKEGFKDFLVLIFLFGGGFLDDDLWVIKFNGNFFLGLFEIVFKNYKYDLRVYFIFVVIEDGIVYIEEIVRKILENGNIVLVNFYSKYGMSDLFWIKYEKRLFDEILWVRELFLEIFVSYFYYIEVMVIGKSYWGDFGYDVCFSVSVDYL